MSRLFLLIGTLVALVASSVGAIAAQEATPATGGGPLSDLGLPEVAIVGTEAGFELPAEVPAGKVLVSLENTAPFPTGFTLIQLPEGVSMEALMSSPEAQEAMAAGGMPPELYDAVWAGGLFAPPGVTAQAVVTLTAGEWILMVPPDAGLPPQAFTVTGEAAAADISIDAVDVELDNFQVRLPEQIAAGPQVWNVTNIGDEPHEVFITRTPERLTVEQAEALLLAPPDATPDPSMPDPAEFMPVGGVLPISQDQLTMVELNLEPGHYVAVCFFPEQESNAPHAALGMVTIFSVGAEGETVKPPASPAPDEHASH